jgi:hypothetical protein
MILSTNQVRSALLNETTVAKKMLELADKQATSSQSRKRWLKHHYQLVQECRCALAK